jgi:gliding motility-associated-like protein
MAYSPTSQFRWFQDVTSGNSFDHWGIDNVEITCGGLVSHVLWNTGDTTYSIVVYPDSTQNYWVMIYDTLYNAKDTVPIIVHQIPTPEFSVNTPICSESDSVVFKHTGIAGPSADFYWTLSGGLSINSHGPGPYILDSLPAGDYMAMLNVNDHGCNSDIDTMWFSVYQKPLVSFSADLTKGCDPIIVSFTNNTYPIDNHYVWEWSDGSSDTNRHQTHYFPYIASDSAYTVTLKATTDLGCYGEYTINNFIAVYPNPEADFLADPDSFNYTGTVIPPVQFNDLTTFDPVSWAWDFGDGTTSNEQNPSYVYNEAGYYLVHLKVVTEYGCEDTVSYLVKVIQELGDSLVFPNVFTPNGDGVNDYFEIDKLEPDHYLGRELVVYNRWGKKVFESNNYLNQWDGAGAPDGTYFFIFRYSFAFASTLEEKEVSGSVTILR